jgi:Tol biopolymer transport system component
MKKCVLFCFTAILLFIADFSPGWGQVKSFDSLQVVWEVKSPGDIFAVSQDESLLVTRNNESYGTKTIKVFNLNSGVLLREFPDLVGEDTARYGLAFMPDNKTIVYACNITYPKGKTRIYRRDIETGIIKDSTFAPDSLYDYAQIRDMQITPDGKYLIICIGEAYLTSSVHLFIYDAQNMELIKRNQRNNTPTKLKVSPNCQYLAFAEQNNDKKTYAVYYYDINKEEFKCIQNSYNDYNGITDIQFSKDSKKIIFSRRNDLIGIYDIEKDSTELITKNGVNFGKIGLL